MYVTAYGPDGNAVLASSFDSYPQYVPMGPHPPHTRRGPTSHTRRTCAWHPHPPHTPRDPTFLTPRPTLLTPHGTPPYSCPRYTSTAHTVPNTRCMQCPVPSLTTWHAVHCRYSSTATDSYGTSYYFFQSFSQNVMASLDTSTWR
jgi:hypothetical protein